MKRMTKAVRDYLELRRSLGYRGTIDDQFRLKGFVRFMQASGTETISTDLAVKFAKQNPDADPAYWGSLYAVVRRFAQYWATIDEDSVVPPPGILPTKFQRPKPYIYAPDEVRRLLKEARQLDSRREGFRGLTYQTLFGLLASTGMRHGEILSLNKDDIDFTQNLIRISGSKFGKSRLIPLHPSTIENLKRYAAFRDRLAGKRSAPAFFVSEQNTRLTKWALRYTFVKLSIKIGIRDPMASHGPRIHDFRHTFAVTVITNWYRAGHDVEQKLPLLSAYLGHVHPSDTYWYLSATPELMKFVGLRLEKRFGALL